MKLDRLIGIISILLQKEKVTAPYLAKKFEVSRRTIIRDVEAISNAGIPLVTEQGQNGGISIMSGFSIDRTALTSSDMNAILTGLQSLDSVSGTKRYQQLMEKLRAGTSNLIPSTENPSAIPETGIYIDLSSYYKSSLSPKIDILRQAVQNHQQVSFFYYSPRGKTERFVNPYLLIFKWSSWYIWAYCNLRSEFRLFKLNRMTDVKICETRFELLDSVQPPECLIERQYPQEVKIKIGFSQEVRWRLIDEFGADQNYREEDGRIIFETYVTGRSSFFPMLLSYGNFAELLEPKELRSEFLEYVKLIAEKYED